MLTDRFTRQATLYQERTGIPKINRLQLGEIPVPLPDFSEQKSIAGILRSVDSKIESELRRSEALVKLFRVLLHCLMAARVRVTDPISTEPENPS
jgi:type I restriction enzyme S subunit